MASFQLEIVTPERIAFSDEVISIVCPTADGYIGVLANHVPLFTRLVEGELKISKGKEDLFLAIGGGFLEVTHKKALILVTSAFHADELNEKEVIEARRRAEKALEEKPEGEELVAAQALFRRSVIAQKVLKRKRRRNVVQSQSSLAS